MSHESILLFTFVWSVGFGLLAQVLAHRWRMPVIVFLLVFGILLGPDVSGFIQPSALGDGLGILVKLAVSIILFEGALNLRLSALRNSVIEVRNLITIGALIAWAGATLCTHYIAHLEWPLAILFGALMTVTGPTVVQPLVKRINIGRKIKTILEGEAILVDPIGAILAVAVLDVIVGLSTPQSSVGIWFVLWSYFGRLIIGLIVGGVIALLLSRILKIPHLIPAELSNLVVLAGVWTSFGLAEKLQSEAGIMASVILGLMLQRETIPGERQLRHFKETLTTLCISVLFILLAGNLSLNMIWQEGSTGFLAVILIMLVVRPSSVFIATWRTTLNWREKLFISWIGPRGIVAASVASLFSINLYKAGIPHGDRLLALTFLMIMMTVTIQGLTAASLAKHLNLQSMEGRGVLIVGANRLGRAIANIIQEYGRPVTFIDTNHLFINEAREAGFTAVHGNALEEDVLEEAEIEEVETIVAITSNQEVNVLVSQFAHDVFGLKRAFPILSNPEKGANVKILERIGGQMGFGKPIDISIWENANIQHFTWEVTESYWQTATGIAQISNELLPVIRLRGKSAEVFHPEHDWKPGDHIIFVTHIPVEQAKEHIQELTSRKS